MGYTIHIKKITTADVVKHWGLSPPPGPMYATCNARGMIRWASARLVTAKQALEKDYKLLS